MPSGLAFLKTAFPSIFSIVDPLAVIPVFLALAGHASREEQRRIALRATLTMFFVLATFAATGTMIFRFFGITVPAFKLAGGVLLFHTALEMIQAKLPKERSTPEEAIEAETKADIALVPLGIPLLSGPGAIATVTVLATRAHGAAERGAIFVSIGLVAILTFIALAFGTFLVRVLKRTGINIATRIMGLILAATSAQFIVDGWHEAAAVFARGG
jgi:multiple antibiotic resistance protein